jgi:FkbM family methyltransferase
LQAVENLSDWLFDLQETYNSKGRRTMPVVKLKPYLQKLLRRVGLYQRTKAFWLYDLYWGIADRRVIDQRRGEAAFYRKVLKGFGNGDLIFDIGANYGEKTDMFLRLGARVVAVEPDECTQEVLRQKFLQWRLSKRPVVIVGKAVSDKNAVETMWIDAPGSALNTLNRKWVESLRVDGNRFGARLNFAQQKEIETVTLEHLIETYGLPFFIKIDVEGYEANVLRGMKHPVRYVSFEVNLPEFRSEGLQCIELLSRVAAQGKFNYTVDCQHGLASDRWVGAQEFRDMFNGCEAKSVEVFWNAPVPAAAMETVA